MYPANKREMGPQSRDLEGVVWWRGKRAYFSFQPGPLLGKCFARMAFCPNEVVDGWDHSMHAREVGKEKPQGLIHSNRLIPRSNKREICHVISSRRKRIH